MATGLWFRESLMLSILNDDCIYKLLEWLPLNDIYSYSRACTRLQTLCGNYFRRKFQNVTSKTVEVRLTSKGYIQWQEKYVRYFNNSIKKLRIHGGPKTSSEQIYLANFVKKKCDLYLNEITIEGCMKWDIFCEETSSFLQYVEIVNLEQGTGRDVPLFLQYCPNLTTLSLCFYSYNKWFDAILEQKYPKLKHFHFQYCSTSLLKDENWETFLQRNNQIHCIEFNKYSNAIDSSAEAPHETLERIKCIAIIVNCLSNLEHLFLSIDDPLSKYFDQICGYLKTLCDRNTFQSMELKFNDRVAKNLLTTHADRLTHFKQLKKIRICSTNSVSSILKLNQIFSPFAHLRSIAIEECPKFSLKTKAKWLRCSVLNEILPHVKAILFSGPSQVEELTVEGDSCIEIFICLIALVRHCKSLQKLSVFDIGFRQESPLFVAMLNHFREKLQDAVPLTIFTDYNDNTTDLRSNLVKLQCVERESHYSVDASKKYCVSSTGHYHCVSKS